MVGIATSDLPPGKPEPGSQDDAKANGADGCNGPFGIVYGIPGSCLQFGLTPVGEHKNRHHGSEICGGLPQGTSDLWSGHGRLGDGFLLLFLAENQVHQETDDDTKN